MKTGDSWASKFSPGSLFHSFGFAFEKTREALSPTSRGRLRRTVNVRLEEKPC
jgi:hypothetical protein